MKSTPSTMIVDCDGVAAGADHRAAADEAEAAALALHARGDERQLLEVAVGHRQRLDLLGDDVGRGVGLDDVDERRLGGDGDRLGPRRCLLHRRVAPAAVWPTRSTRFSSATGTNPSSSRREVVARRAAARRTARCRPRRSTPCARRPVAGFVSLAVTPGSGSLPASATCSSIAALLTCATTGPARIRPIRHAAATGRPAAATRVGWEAFSSAWLSPPGRGAP